MEHGRLESTQPSSESEMEPNVQAIDDEEFAETEESRKLVQSANSAITVPLDSEVTQLNAAVERDARQQNQPTQSRQFVNSNYLNPRQSSTSQASNFSIDLFYRREIQYSICLY